jgi:hypothetical protein
VNLESFETTGFVVCLSDALQVRAIMNGRIDMSKEGYLYVRLFVRILYMQSAISCDAFPLRHAVHRVYDVIGRCIETRQWSIGFELQEHETHESTFPMM